MQFLRSLFATAACCVLLLAGCSSSRSPVDSPTDAPAAVSYAGFDTWRYPGDEAMDAWRDAAPYEWVGVYLPAPCHRDSSWAGTRAKLEADGWGTAALYVGQQAFDGEPASVAGEGPILCSRTLLTEEQGRTDARDAIAKTRSEGFISGSVVYLDVERTARVSDSLRTYVGAWTRTVLDDDEYMPGLYVHQRNAAALFATVLGTYRDAGRSDTPPVWIAGGAGFALDASPRASGSTFASVWQGILDAERTWGGVTLRIDENVADRPSPSAPR